MTDIEINVAVAEACKRKWKMVPPDFANDLNAMHEAENTLYGIQCENYARLLTGVGQLFYPVAHATARRRSKAFLRTLGKWKDAQ